MKICPVCGGNKIAVKYKNSLYDDRYGYKGFYSLFKCKQCSHGWLDAKFKPEELEALYTNYYPRSSLKLDSYKPSSGADGFMAWLDGKASSTHCYVPPDVRVLDIGCGFCETLGYHSARGCDAYGVEADANVVKISKEKGFNVHNGLFDPGIYQHNFFDFVTLNQVIEHAQEPIQMLDGVSRILKKGGVAVIGTTNSNSVLAKLLGRFWVHWHAPYHLQQFSVKSMSAAASKCGLEMESFLTLTHSDWLYYQQIHFFVRPSEGVPAAFWSERGKCGFIAKAALKLLPYFHKIRFNHLITRLLDFSGSGDNLLFFLRKP